MLVSRQTVIEIIVKREEVKSGLGTQCPVEEQDGTLKMVRCAGTNFEM